MTPENTPPCGADRADLPFPGGKRRDTKIRTEKDTGL